LSHFFNFINLHLLPAFWQINVFVSNVEVTATWLPLPQKEDCGFSATPLAARRISSDNHRHAIAAGCSNGKTTALLHGGDLKEDLRAGYN